MAYMEPSLGQLGTVDLTTGATSIIGFIGGGSGNGFNSGLGVASGTLCATNNNGILGQLWSVGPRTEKWKEAYHHNMFDAVALGIIALENVKRRTI